MTVNLKCSTYFAGLIADGPAISLGATCFRSPVLDAAGQSKPCGHLMSWRVRARSITVLFPYQPHASGGIAHEAAIIAWRKPGCIQDHLIYG